MNKLTLLFFATTALFLSSCKGSEDKMNTISLDDAAEIISTSVSKDAAGITTSIEGSVEGVEILSSLAPTSMRRATGELTNTYSIDTTYAYAAIYSNTIHYEYSLLFDTESKPYVPVTYTSEGYFEGERISATHTGSGSYTLSNFYLNTTCDLDGTFHRTSTQQSKITNKQSHASTKLVCENIVIDKASHLIQSGTITVDIEGSTNIGNFIFNGVVTYLGNNTAKMIIEGKTYSLNLETGVYTVAQ